MPSNQPLATGYCPPPRCRWPSTSARRLAAGSSQPIQGRAVVDPHRHAQSVPRGSRSPFPEAAAAGVIGRRFAVERRPSSAGRGTEPISGCSLCQRRRWFAQVPWWMTALGIACPCKAGQLASGVTPSVTLVREELDEGAARSSRSTASTPADAPTRHARHAHPVPRPRRWHALAPGRARPCSRARASGSAIPSGATTDPASSSGRAPRDGGERRQDLLLASGDDPAGSLPRRSR